MKTEDEIWKRIPGFGDCYEASNLGRIRSIDRLSVTGDRRIKGKIMGGGLYSNGYALVVLSVGKDKRVTTSKHRLVAMAFIPNPENKRCVNHKNSIRTDNRVENLEWVTHKENTQHGVNAGRIKLRGEDAHAAILNERAVRYIRDNPQISYKDLAKKYNVNEFTIFAVRNRRNWKHIV